VTIAPAIDLVSLVANLPATREVAAALRASRRVVATGAVGSSTTLLAGALAQALDRPVMLVVAHLDDADEAHDELLAWGTRCLRLPAIATSSADAAVADLVAARLRAARAAPAISGPHVVVASIQALMQGVPPPARLKSLTLAIRPRDRLAPKDILAWLAASAYRRAEAVEEPGDFALRGGILDIFPAAPATDDAPEPAPIRIEFFGDEVERITEIDPDTMGSDRALPAIELVALETSIDHSPSDRTRTTPSARNAKPHDDSINFLELLPANCVALLAETMEVVEQGRGYYERVTEGQGVFGPPAVLKLLERRPLAEVNQFSSGASSADIRVDLPFAPLPHFPKEAEGAVKELASLVADDSRALVCCQTPGESQRFGELLAQHAPTARVGASQTYLHRGLALRDASGAQTFLVSYHELLSRFTSRRAIRGVKSQRALDTFLDFDEGDYVVHADHGIARYVGLSLMTPRELPIAQRPVLTPGAPKAQAEQEEYLTLEFASKARLHVPAMQIDKVQKYVGGFSGKPQLSVLGGQKWKGQKDRVAESVRDLAAELLRVRAAREHLPGLAFPNDTTWQREFEGEFPYEETQDQLAALQELKRDMQASRPMDRLICGDVGFGKTELAIRAAFKAVEFGKQVAVLVPTTVLAEQHERTFGSRFAGYPFRVESISRFKSDAQVREVLKDLRKGHVDLIIGTHRLLSQDVVFNDLALVVVDEEQRFGVEHKESLLRLRLTVDVLTLSATPIPRTLHMAMLGIRDISSLTTPPADRRAIVTEVLPFNPIRVRQAIERELSREGQVFFVHNRVHDIRSAADDVHKLAPEARIVVGHGQMAPHELEDVMLKFIRREADILVSTTIIESGIDIPTANTIIIDDADRFGLSDLHQLRGRVGRGKHRGYCYLLLPPERNVKDTAQKRLRALEQYSMLGAGFKIAMRDLEIRGAGNILGPEQSGHIAAVGYDMYCRLLEGAVHDLKHDAPVLSPSATTVELGITAIIPRAYMPSDKRRLAVYRRLTQASTPDQLALARRDLIDAYGPPPQPVERLFDLAELRLRLAQLDVRSATIREKDVIFHAKDAHALAAELARHVPTQAASAATIRILEPEEPAGLPMVYFRPPPAYLEPATLLTILRKRLGLATSDPPRPPKPSKPAASRTTSPGHL
jgi:transcription-repair coupling factor (superfamily II helicase)